LEQLAPTFDPSDLCTAARPMLLATLLDRFPEEAVIYLDPDILLMRRLEEVRPALAAGSIVLTPHLLAPLPRDGLRPGDQDILSAGAFNLGFIALKRSEQPQAFLRWWQEYLRGAEGIIPADIPLGIITDQKRFDLVPMMFSETVILHDDTYHVAWWNLH